MRIGEWKRKWKLQGLYRDYIGIIGLYRWGFQKVGWCFRSLNSKDSCAKISLESQCAVYAKVGFYRVQQTGGRSPEQLVDVFFEVLIPSLPSPTAPSSPM